MTGTAEPEAVAVARPAYDLSLANKGRDAWWTVLVVDPVLKPFLPLVVRMRAATPDRITLAGLALSLLAGLAFLDDRLVLGAVLFELHFLLDCLDGKVARIKGLQNPRGAFLDLSADLVGTAWCFGALGISVVGGTGHAELALLTAVLYVAYTWSTLHRRTMGDLKAQAPRDPDAPLGFLARHRLSPLPYGVEVEALVLFLLPLTTSVGAAQAGLAVASAFFVLATLRNLASALRASDKNHSRSVT